MMIFYEFCQLFGVEYDLNLIFLKRTRDATLPLKTLMHPITLCILCNYFKVIYIVFNAHTKVKKKCFLLLVGSQQYIVAFLPKVGKVSFVHH